MQDGRLHVPKQSPKILWLCWRVGVDNVNQERLSLSLNAKVLDLVLEQRQEFEWSESGKSKAMKMGDTVVFEDV